MTNFYFRISDGRFSSSVNHAIKLADRDAAWQEMILVSKDLVGRYRARYEAKRRMADGASGRSQKAHLPDPSGRGDAGQSVLADRPRSKAIRPGIHRAQSAPRPIAISDDRIKAAANRAALSYFKRLGKTASNGTVSSARPSLTRIHERHFFHRV